MSSTFHHKLFTFSSIFFQDLKFLVSQCFWISLSWASIKAPIYTVVSDCDHENTEGLKTDPKAVPLKFKIHLCAGLGCEG